MSWKPEVQTRGDEKFYSNNLAFETKEEAEKSGEKFDGKITEK